MVRGGENGKTKQQGGTRKKGRNREEKKKEAEETAVGEVSWRFPAINFRLSWLSHLRETRAGEGTAPDMKRSRSRLDLVRQMFKSGPTMIQKRVAGAYRGGGGVERRAVGVGVSLFQRHDKQGNESVIISRNCLPSSSSPQQTLSLHSLGILA